MLLHDRSHLSHRQHWEKLKDGAPPIQEEALRPGKNDGNNGWNGKMADLPAKSIDQRRTHLPLMQRRVRKRSTRSALRRRIPLLRPPFEAQPGHVAQLNAPRNGIGGDGELVVENGCLIHACPRFSG
jgi:hypothetical protein